MFNKLLAFICSLLLASGPVGIQSALAADFNGAWSGSWSSDFSTGGRLGATLTQTGSTLSGTLDIYSTDCGNVLGLALSSGTVSGNSASFAASITCGGSFNQLSYTNGTLSGNTINGDYTILADGSFWDSGTFTLNRLCCTITATAGPGGSIAPSGPVTLTPASSLTFSITANTGYTIADVTVDGVSQGAIPDYSFTNVQADHTISATFTKLASGALPFMDLLLKKK
jgi:hypothetical protein